MQQNLILLTLSVILVATSVLAAPGFRIKRDDGSLDDIELNPIALEDSIGDGLDRDKRKVHDFGTKNALLGFVFGKIDSFIDSKTRFLNALDQQNIAKNKLHNIEAPKPITTFQDLITAVITPKITGLTQKLGSLSGSFLGGAGGGSGSFLGGGSAGGLSSGGASDESGQSAGPGGLGGILSSVLRLSGPLLSSSSGGAASGGTKDTSAEDDDDDV